MPHIYVSIAKGRKLFNDTHGAYFYSFAITTHVTPAGAYDAATINLLQVAFPICFLLCPCGTQNEREYTKFDQFIKAHIANIDNKLVLAIEN